jgi:hypothetical protein
MVGGWWDGGWIVVLRCLVFLEKKMDGLFFGWGDPGRGGVWGKIWVGSLSRIFFRSLKLKNPPRI